MRTRNRESFPLPPHMHQFQYMWMSWPTTVLASVLNLLLVYSLVYNAHIYLMIACLIRYWGTLVECFGTSIGELAPNTTSLSAISFLLIPGCTNVSRIAFFLTSLFSASLCFQISLETSVGSQCPHNCLAIRCRYVYSACSALHTDTHTHALQRIHQHSYY